MFRDINAIHGRKKYCKCQPGCETTVKNIQNRMRIVKVFVDKQIFFDCILKEEIWWASMKVLELEKRAAEIHRAIQTETPLQGILTFEVKLRLN